MCQRIPSQAVGSCQIRRSGGWWFFPYRAGQMITLGWISSLSSTAHECSSSTGPLVQSMRAKGDFGFNVFHNSNPQHGGAYARHERKMRDDEFEDFLLSVKGWDHDPEEQSIWRSFYFESTEEAYLFMGRLYAFCYGTDKYPHITWEGTRIDIHLYSPTFKGLSKREARVAAFLNDQVNMLKKSKLQRNRLMEMAKETTVEALVGDSVREAKKIAAEDDQPLPEVRSGMRTWADLVEASARSK
mmetsp:Transcript_38099/g.44413  ORF Transcript_38099/g.44413 Transcript_38099/m.44413 type:complete len:243 (+) Transcript_38099:100-828(+)